MQCTSPIKLHVFDIEVPCRKCIACRIARSREWAVRLVHENAMHQKASFATLTYDDQHLVPSLDKAELQRFLKRLRYDLELQGRRIRYFAVGEYGGRFKRPHYHMIVFGLDNTDHRMRRNHVLGGPLLDAWGKGFVYLGTVRAASIRYVTDYIFKQFDGSRAKEAYGDNVPPFKLHSKGLGLEWVKTHQPHLLAKLAVTTGQGGSIVPLPRYYLDKLSGNREDILAARALLADQAKQRRIKRLSELGIEASEIAAHMKSVRKLREQTLLRIQSMKQERSSWYS